MTWNRTAPVFARIARRLAAVAERTAPRHRELMRAMIAELDTIDNHAEHRRFAAGAIGAAVQLVGRGCRERLLHASGMSGGTWQTGQPIHSGDRPMPIPSAQQLLRRHVAPFVVALGALTGVMLANYAARVVPQLASRGEPTSTLLEAMLLAVPFVLALTVPMAAFIAVTWVFTRLGAEGCLDAARREPRGMRRLLAPVLAASTVLAAVMFVSNDQAVPRTNRQLASIVTGSPQPKGGRSMTIGELRHAVRAARANPNVEASWRALEYSVEIQKKFAISVACIVLALMGAVLPLRFPRGGSVLVLGASLVVFGGYYMSLMTGESLADQQRIAPWVGMWTANLCLLALTLLLLANRSSRQMPRAFP